MIGINTAIYAKAQGIGFAIPINKAEKIVSDLIKYGEVVHAWIGIIVQDIDASLAKYLNVSENIGVLIKKVENNGPAYNAGINNGDIILSIGEKKVSSEKDYQTIIRDFAAGETIDIKISRNGKNKRYAVKATVFPKERAMDLAYNLLGISVENLSIKNRYLYKTDSKEGVVISDLHPQSYLAHIGARAGDIIRQINDITIKNVKDFEKAVIRYRKKSSVAILLQRGDQLYNITVKL